MATDTRNRRPDPAGDQRDVLNKAVGKGAIAAPAVTRQVDAASLDTFNGPGPERAAEAAAADLALRQEDDGLLRQRDGSDGDAADRDGLGRDQAERADEAAQHTWEAREDGGQSEDGEAQQSPFEFSNPAIDRLRDNLTSSLGVDEEPAQGFGTAAGKHAPGISGGRDGTASDSGARGRGGAANGSDGRGGGGGGAYNPFTGEGIGTDAYAEAGAPGMPDMHDPRAGRGFGSDGQLAALTGMLASQGRHSTTPSVADGPGDTTDVDGEAITRIDSVDVTDDIVSDSPVNHDGDTEPSGPPEDMTDEATGAVVGAVIGALGPVGQVLNAGYRGYLAGQAANEALTNLGVTDAVVDAAVAKTDGGQYAAEQDKKAAEAQAAAQAREKAAADKKAADDKSAADKKAADDKAAADKKDADDKAAGDEKAADEKTTPGAKDQLPPGSDDLGGPPTAEEMAFRSYLRNAAHYHGSPGHNEGVTTPTNEPIDTGHAAPVDKVGMLGQPVRDGEGSTGQRGPGNLGRRPGDTGNIDNGPDDTGAFVSNPRTEEPGDALGSLGGSGLSIADARRNSDDDDDDKDDDDSGT